MTKTFAEMDAQERRNWAIGYLLVAVGTGRFHNAVDTVIRTITAEVREETRREWVKEMEESPNFLRLTAKEQTVLAELASLCRTVQYDIRTKRELADPQIAEKLTDLLVRFDNVSPQDFDSMYDKLHRTGANA